MVQALAKQVNRYYAQSDVALHCSCLALPVAIGWSRAADGFCGSTVHLPELHTSVGQGEVSSDLSSIYVPQEVSSHFRGMRFLVPLLLLLAL